MQSVVGVAMVPEAILEKLEPMKYYSLHTSPAHCTFSYVAVQFFFKLHSNPCGYLYK